MGAGSSSATNTQNITSNIMSDISTSMSATQEAGTGEDQTILVENTSGNVDIEGVSQSQTVTLSINGLASQLSSTSAQQSIVQALQQAAAATTSGIPIGGMSSSSNNTINSVMNATLDVATNLSQLCKGTTAQTQQLVVKNTSGNVTLKDIGQTQVANVIATCIQNASSATSSLQKVDQEISQKAKATTTGLDLGALMLDLLLMLLAPIAIAVALGVVGMTKFFPLLLGLALLGFGGACYYKYKKSGSSIPTMFPVGFSTLIKNDPKCGAIQYTPAPLPPSSTPPSGNEASKLAIIQQQCVNDPNCVAFDYDVSVTPPAVTFYNSITPYSDPDVPPTTLVSSIPPNTTTTTKYTNPAPCADVVPKVTSGISLTNDAVFYQGPLGMSGIPPANIGMMGDIYLNNTDGKVWWHVLSDPKAPWAQVGLFPGWTDGITPTVTASNQTPDNALGADGDYYINTTDPNNWEIFTRIKGVWGAIPSTTKSTSTMAAAKPGVNKGTVLKSAYAQQNGMAFPGRHGNTPPQETYNWSAFKISNPMKTIYLYAAIVLFIFGGLFTIAGCYKIYSSSSSSSTEVIEKDVVGVVGQKNVDAAVAA